MAAQPLTSLDRSTLRERALEALRAAITSGEYRPGSHLGEEELARRLGVSRGTVREALSELDNPDRDFSAHVDADLGFHLLLCELSGNSLLIDAWRHLEGRVRVAILGDGADQLMTGSNHAPIVDAVEAGDVAQAVKVLQDHMLRAADRIAGPAEIG